MRNEQFKGVKSATPVGSYLVDAAQLQAAKSKVPRGEYHQA